MPLDKYIIIRHKVVVHYSTNNKGDIHNGNTLWP